MVRPLDDFTAAVSAATRTLVGWTAVVIATTLCGLWLGASIGRGELPSREELFLSIVLLPVMPFLDARLFCAAVVTGITWYLPLQYDSKRLKIGTALANFVAWAGLAAWTFWRVPF